MPNNKPELEIVSYQKSWLSVHSFYGCNFDCKYCLLFLLNETSQPPHRVSSEKNAIEQLTNSRYFIADKTHVCVNNRTEPFHPLVKESTYKMVNILNSARYKNPVGIITRLNPGQNFLKRFTKFKNVKLFFFVTYSGLPKTVEIPSSRDRLQLMTVLTDLGLNVIHYWRPLIYPINTAPCSLKHVLNEVKGISNCSVATGIRISPRLFPRIKQLSSSTPIRFLNKGGTYITPHTLRILQHLADEVVDTHPIFFHTSCAVSFLLKEIDYNAHFFADPSFCSFCPQKCKDKWQNSYQKIKNSQVMRDLKHLEPQCRLESEITPCKITIKGTIQQQTKYYLTHKYKIPILASYIPQSIWKKYGGDYDET